MAGKVPPAEGMTFQWLKAFGWTHVGASKKKNQLTSTITKCIVTFWYLRPGDHIKKWIRTQAALQPGLDVRALPVPRLEDNASNGVTESDISDDEAAPPGPAPVVAPVLDDPEDAEPEKRASGNGKRRRTSNASNASASDGGGGGGGSADAHAGGAWSALLDDTEDAEPQPEDPSPAKNPGKRRRSSSSGEDKRRRTSTGSSASDGGGGGGGGAADAHDACGGGSASGGKSVDDVVSETRDMLLGHLYAKELSTRVRQAFVDAIAGVRAPGGGARAQ
ncbi:hypothetical protein JKP88DRAFT_326266 [Tribonema minus]|uniref:Uncharacterized protein n=1 Tax=Tribonema minus TaxID=303371 RepID=A0A835YU66_9STRA|nr:hypothetical protein JKP88DRAFT_326266 [Tribonema minus]